MDIITLYNIISLLKVGWGIKKQRLYNPVDKWRKYKLLEGIDITLSTGKKIYIGKGFEWDLSSVPRFLWSFLPPDGDWELAAIIHDYLYRYQLGTRKEADKEMLIWSKKIHHTKSKISLRRLDNKIRYWGVRLFGKKAWKK